MAMVEGSSGLSEEGPSATPKGGEHCSGKGKTSPREEGMKCEGWRENSVYSWPVSVCGRGRGAWW